MNRLKRLFEHKHNGILAVYFTAGYPEIDRTADTIAQLADAGADIIEVGMPFSDPLADGPTIQQSSKKALDMGMSIGKLMDQLEGLREKTSVPLVLMGYLNPVLQFGMERFCRRCREVGVDGLILPDMPLFWFEHHGRPHFEANGLSSIFLVTPQTPDERIRQLDAASSGFLYAVSTSTTTGGSSGFGEKQQAYFRKLAAMKLKNPVLVGFGISLHSDFSNVCRHLNGAVVGSAFIRAQERGMAPADFIAGLKGPAFQKPQTIHQKNQKA